MATQAEILPDAERALIASEAAATSVEGHEARRTWAFRVMRDPRLLAMDLALLLVALYRQDLPTTLHLVGSRSALLNTSFAARDLLIVATCLMAWSLSLWVCGIFRQYSSGRLACSTVAACTLCTLAVQGAYALYRPGQATHGALLLFWCGAALALCMPRLAIYGSAQIDSIKKKRTKRNVVLVGSGPLALELAAKLRHHSRENYFVLGFVDNRPQAEYVRGLGMHLGSLDDLEPLLMTNVVDQVHIALPFKSQYDEIQETVRLCESAGVEPHYLAEMFPTQVTKKQQTMDGQVVLRLTHADSRWLLKRGFDLFSACLLLTLLSPLMLLIAALVWITDPGPVLFRQYRFGLNRRKFPMLKFRSMSRDAEERQAGLEHMNEAVGPVFKIARDPRVTRVGAFLRKTSLDELPQLFNVIAGQMSLVGPRPLTARDVQHFSELHLMRRFSVIPGMTGLWQVSGRSDLTFEQWIDLDLEYIDHWSLKLDAEILLRTLPAVLRGRGAS